MSASHPALDAIERAHDELIMARRSADDAQDRLAATVRSAHEQAGCSWSQIGRTLGVTRQSAHARYARID